MERQVIIISSFTDVFKDLAEWISGDPIKEGAKNMIVAGESIWTNMCDNVYDILGQTPASFSGSAWTMVTSGGVGQAFIAVGASLFPLFFLFHFCSSSVNVREELSLENIIKMFIKIAFGEALVVNCFSLLNVIFSIVGNFVTLLAGKGATDISKVIDTGSNAMAKNIDGLSTFECLFVYLLAIIYFLASAIISLLLLFAIYLRLFKLIVLTPFSALAFSTYVGSEGFSSISRSYIKYFVSVALEALFMMVVLMVCNKILSSASIVNLTGWIGSIDKKSLTYVLVLMLQNIFMMGLTVSLVRASQRSMERMIGT